MLTIFSWFATTHEQKSNWRCFRHRFQGLHLRHDLLCLFLGVRKRLKDQFTKLQKFRHLIVSNFTSKKFIGSSLYSFSGIRTPRQPFVVFMAPILGRPTLNIWNLFGRGALAKKTQFCLVKKVQKKLFWSVLFNLPAAQRFWSKYGLYSVLWVLRNSIWSTLKTSTIFVAFRTTTISAYTILQFLKQLFGKK